MKKWLVSLGIFLLVALLGFSIWAYANVRDRHPGYAVDLDIRQAAPAPLNAGFAALTITPEIVDTWSDKNGDARFNVEAGDSYHDNNHNGRFDAGLDRPDSAMPEQPMACTTTCGRVAW